LRKLAALSLSEATRSSPRRRSRAIRRRSRPAPTRRPQLAVETQRSRTGQSTEHAESSPERRQLVLEARIFGQQPREYDGYSEKPERDGAGASEHESEQDYGRPQWMAPRAASRDKSCRDRHRVSRLRA
jgi:hypothetical protein